MTATALLYIPLRLLEKHWRGVEECRNLGSVKDGVKLGVKSQDKLL